MAVSAICWMALRAIVSRRRKAARSRSAAATIAYVAIGEEGRRDALTSWTREILREQGRESWGKTFRFGSAPLGEMYETPLFDGQVWYRPDQDAPVGLFEE